MKQLPADERKHFCYTSVAKVAFNFCCTSAPKVASRAILLIPIYKGRWPGRHVGRQVGNEVGR